VGPRDPREERTRAETRAEGGYEHIRAGKLRKKLKFQRENRVKPWRREADTNIGGRGKTVTRFCEKGKHETSGKGRTAVRTKERRGINPALCLGQLTKKKNKGSGAGRQEWFQGKNKFSRRKF